jgi:hypothetical protein
LDRILSVLIAAVTVAILSTLPSPPLLQDCSSNDLIATTDIDKDGTTSAAFTILGA